MGAGALAALTLPGWPGVAAGAAVAAPQLIATDPAGIDLVIDHTDLVIGGRPTRGITVNGTLPGPVIRMTEGRDAVIRVHNRMDESTSIHWHGLLLPYTMDGVPGISFAGIPPRSTFTYRFRVRQNGTYWYHSHTGMQEQLGLFGQLVLEPAGADPVASDVEHSVMLSDYTFENPDAVMRNLKVMEGYYNFQRPTLANLDEQMKRSGMSAAEALKMRLAWQRMRMDPTDLADVTGATYSFLINGRTAAENPTFKAEPGQRVRLRVYNGSAVTFFDLRIPGVALTVVASDGQNLQPVETDEFRIAVAEGYDVLFTMPDRPVTLYAETMDRSGFARGTFAPSTAANASATVPERRPRPMLTMADMGMAGMGGMAGMDTEGSGDMAGMDMGHGMSHDMGGMDLPTLPANETARPGPPLPVTGLPDTIAHEGDTHGPGSIAMGMTNTRRLDYPGIGLGDDGRRVLTYRQMQCRDTPPDRRPPTRELNLHLTGNMEKYIWGINGKKWSESDMLRFQYGERLRLNFINDTMMTHPMHLHGMWMDLYTGGDYAAGPRKHTVRVEPADLLTVDITADAPGQWAFHCHVMYHMDAGMFRTVAVVRSLDEGAIDADA